MNIQEIMASKVLWFLVVSTTFIQHTTSDSDWTRQCSVCSCIWVSGRRTANCSNKGFNHIPKDLSTVVRDIDFSYNPLYSLSDGEFLSANLADVHKLKLPNCSIEIVSEGAFKRLALMIELDLSWNKIDELKKYTFKDTVKLRVLSLSHNRIKELEDGLFNNLSFIQRIHIDHNEIEHISEDTFYNLPALTDINLGHNKLKTVSFDLKQRLPKLNSLNVEANPWICDCHLELFHQSIIRNNLITLGEETRCAEPPRMQGRSWVIKESFPCAPEIMYPASFSEVTADRDNITLTCKVTGDPEPDVDWTNNGHIVERDPRKNKQKYFTSKSRLGEFTWNNLTITNLSYRDRGEYRCIAKNPGGEDEKNVTLIIDFDSSSSIPGLKNSSLLIIGLSVGLLILLIIILILVCLFCKRTIIQSPHLKRREHDQSSEECVNMSGNMDMKKGLVTDINPICKPPRVTVPASVVSGGTEVSDVKRNLLDNESVFDCDDESRSFDFDQPLLRKSQNALLEPEYRHPYPPDLLSFPPRSQISPAGSNASTVVMDSRLPPHHGPQSPLHSPIYDQLSMYKTLPYSRSHSPFAQGMGVPRVPRQGAGYVTIPRRPRQSWSSEPPHSGDVIAEPVYDNLGVRSTADGSSVLSLNKTPSETASTPRSNRLFPLTSTNIDPIVESHESPPSISLQPEKTSPLNPKPTPLSLLRPSIASSKQPQPDGPVIQSKPLPNPKPKTRQKPLESQTLPRNLNSKLTPSKTQWAIDNASQLQSPSDKRNSIASDAPSVEGKVKKIPPLPPPKPKKRVTSGPLFEDEGEDGTEV